MISPPFWTCGFRARIYREERFFKDVDVTPLFSAPIVKVSEQYCKLFRTFLQTFSLQNCNPYDKMSEKFCKPLTKKMSARKMNFSPKFDYLTFCGQERRERRKMMSGEGLLPAMKGERRKERKTEIGAKCDLAGASGAAVGTVPRSFLLFFGRSGCRKVIFRERGIGGVNGGFRGHI